MTKAKQPAPCMTIAGAIECQWHHSEAGKTGFCEEVKSYLSAKNTQQFLSLARKIIKAGYIKRPAQPPTFADAVNYQRSHFAAGKTEFCGEASLFLESLDKFWHTLEEVREVASEIRRVGYQYR